MIINILIDILIVFCSYKLFQQAAGTLALGKINLISYVYYLCVVQSLLGAILVSLNYDEHYTLNKLVFKNESIHMATYSVYFMMIALPLVMLIVFKLCKFDPQKEYNDFLKKETKALHDNKLFVCIAFISIIQIGFLIILLLKIGYVPIYKMFVHESTFDLAIERQINAGIDVFNISYIKSIVILFGIPIISYITLSYAIANRELKWIIISIIYFFASLVTQTYDFSKSPIVFHFFVYLLIVIYYKGGIKNTIVMIFGSGMACVLLLFYKLFGFQGSFFDIYNGILGRTLFTQFGTLCYHFDLFPNVFDYLSGRSLYPLVLKIVGMQPEEHIRSAKLVMDFYGSNHVYEGTAGVMNSVFIGEAYANWGVYGILLSILWVGIFISLLFILIMKIKKTPATIAFLAIVTKTVGSMSQGGFVDFIYNASLVLIICGFICIIYFDDLYKYLKLKFICSKKIKE